MTIERTASPPSDLGLAARDDDRHACNGALPPLHCADDRELVVHLGPWEVRRHVESDPRFMYFARRAFLHVQLWHQHERISVLTPSRLTGNRFEIATGSRRLWVATWPAVLELLGDYELPRGAELAAITMWLVVRAEVAALRSRHSQSPSSAATI